MTFNGTPKPAILYTGSEAHAKKVRYHLASKLEPLDMIAFDDDDSIHASARRAQAAQYHSTDTMNDRLREVGRS